MVTATSLVSIRSTWDFVSCCNITQAGSQSITAHSTPALPLLPVFLLLALGKRLSGEELSMDSHLKDFLGFKKIFSCLFSDRPKQTLLSASLLQNQYCPSSQRTPCNSCGKDSLGKWEDQNFPQKVISGYVRAPSWKLHLYRTRYQDPIRRNLKSCQPQ